MRKHIFLYLQVLLLAIPLSVASKPVIDSLELSLLGQLPDTTRVRILNDLSWEYRNMDFNKAMRYAQKSMELAQQINDIKGLRDAQNRLGMAFKNMGDYTRALEIYQDVLASEEKAGNAFGIARAGFQVANVLKKTGHYEEALAYLEKSRELFHELDDKLNEAKAYNLLGSIHLFRSHSDKALQAYQKALDLRIALQDSAGIARSHLNLGLLYQQIGNYAKSQECLRHSTHIFKQHKSFRNLARCYNNMGNNCYHLQDYDEAMVYYYKSLELKSDVQDIASQPYTFLNMGLIYQHTNRGDSALLYYEKAYEMFKAFDNKRGQISALLNRALISNQLGKTDDALSLLEHGLALCDDAEDLFLKAETLKALSESYTLKGDFKKAIHYGTLCNHLKDSLNRIYTHTINEKVRYQEEQQKLAIAEKDREIAISQFKRTRLLNHLLITSLIGLLIFIVIMSLFFRQMHKRTLAETNLKINKQQVNELLKNSELRTTYARLEGQDDERRRIARDLHDGLGSLISTIKLYFGAVEGLALASESEDKQKYFKANELLDKASDEVHRIAKDMNSGLLAKFGLIAGLQDLAETIHNGNSLKVKIIENGFNSRLSVQVEGKVYRIIQELVSNVLKHAEASHLNIQLTRFNGSLNILVEDDGKGFDLDAAMRTNRLGLKNVEARVAELGGELNIDTGKGAGTTISIDINVNKSI